MTEISEVDLRNMALTIVRLEKERDEARRDLADLRAAMKGIFEVTASIPEDSE